MLKWPVILCCHSVCDGGETKSPRKSYAGKKRPKKGDLPNDAWKGYLKTYDRWNNQRETYKGTYSAPLNPQLQVQNCCRSLGYGLRP